jgi:hypothetical protein
MTNNLPKAQTIVCKFSCYPCGVRRMPVVCEVRGADEDMVAYTRRTAAHIGKVHRMIHSHCRNPQLDELIIPVPESAPRIGDPETH